MLIWVSVFTLSLLFITGTVNALIMITGDVCESGEKLSLVITILTNTKYKSGAQATRWTITCSQYWLFDTRTISSPEPTLPKILWNGYTKTSGTEFFSTAFYWPKPEHAQLYRKLINNLSPDFQRSRARRMLKLWVRSLRPRTWHSKH